MFDNLLGTKFGNKSKHAIKCTATRLEAIRRKKQAMLRFLRKDVADLIANGLEINAYGRIDALIVETNHGSCYEMIQHYCEYIKSQLPTLQKRECPNVNEVMEAVATLIYAAARFSDLPELCDLRRIFIERYGSDMETSISAEFVEKMQKKSFSTDKKLRVMQEIAQEFSVRWDSKAFQQKMCAPAASVSDQPRKGTPISNQVNKPLVTSTTRKAVDTEMPSQAAPSKGKFESALRRDHPSEGTPTHKQSDKPLRMSNDRKEGMEEVSCKGKVDATLRKDQPTKGTPTRNQINKLLPTSARKEVDTEKLIPEVQCKVSFETTPPRSTSQKKVQREPRVIPVVSSSNNEHHFERASKVVANEPENVEPFYRNPVPPLYFTKGIPKDVQRKDSFTYDRSPRSKAEGLIGIGTEVVGAGRVASMVPPYTKSKGSKPERSVEENHGDQYVCHMSPSVAQEPMVPEDHERQSVNRVNSSNGGPSNMNPPYVKPKANNLPANEWSSGDEFKHPRGLLDKKPDPLSVRRRRTKPRVFCEVETIIDDTSAVCRTPSGRRRHGEQQSDAIYDGDCNDGEMRMDRDPQLPVWDEMTVNPTPSGRRRHGNRRNTDVTYDNYCDDEIVMDKLLMHYSTKGKDNKPGKTRTRTRAPPAEISADASKVLEEQSDVSFYERVTSLPTKSVRQSEVIRGPARTASMQPEMLSPSGRCTYPKIPEYDDLTARFMALRGA